jgi:hypothetical protein
MQHANAKHHGHHVRTSSQMNESVQQRSLLQPLRPEHDETLWSTPITMTNQISQDDNVEMEDIVPNKPSSQGEDLANIAEDLENEPHYNLRKRIRSSENIQERVEEIFEESEIELQLPVNFEDTDIDPEDLQGASLDDALDTIEGKNVPENIAKWPNEAYREFMELIVEGNISNNIGDKMIKFFNKHSNLEKSPLLSSTKNGKDYLNQINSPSVDFKEKVVATYNEVNFTLYYRPIFRAIQTLLQRPEVANNFVYKGNLKKMKVCLII